MNPILDIQHLSVWYEKNNFVLEDINLSLKQGYVYGLLGVNGAGKTTLLNTLTGINRSFRGFFKMDDIKVEPDANLHQWHESKKKTIFCR